MAEETSETARVLEALDVLDVALATLRWALGARQCQWCHEDKVTARITLSSSGEASWTYPKFCSDRCRNAAMSERGKARYEEAIRDEVRRQRRSIGA